MDYISLSKEADEKIDLGRYEEAKNLLEKGLFLAKKNRNKSFTEFFIGELQNIDGNYELAIPHHKKAVELTKKIEFKAFFLKNLGVTLSFLGREEEAIEWYDRALEIKPDDYDSLRDKGVSLSKLGRMEEAIEWYDRALEIKPDDWLNLVFKAFTLESIGNEEEAIKIFDFISGNEDKVKDEEIIKVVNFKKNALKEKEQDKKTDVLNEVINAFQEKKDDFFKNINHIECRFKKFVDSDRSIPEGFFSFLSVLRKWNSYTPILPSEKGDNKGGGYFLYHRGKGIVIDPGFNFIENFYQEGFKVADIDAVLITHAHNDHTVDLESILTLVYKHNDAIEDAVKEKMKGKKEDKIRQEIRNRLKEKGKKIDLFMNVGTFMKYSGWLNLKDSHEINSVTILMPNTTYKLPEEYHDITIYTTKAKHHEVIDEQYAIGFILDVDGVKIGFTGDTGWDWDRDEVMVKPFTEHNPRLVVAHLGSIKSTEFDYVKATCDNERNNCFYRHHLGLLGMTKFLDVTKPELTIISEFGEELRGMRKPIVERIGKVLGLNCLPGDIGLHIRLSDLGVYCFVEEDFVDYKLINVYSDDSERGSTLCFHRSEPDHEIFNKALAKKQRSVSIPFFKRMKTHEVPHG